MELASVTLERLVGQLKGNGTFWSARRDVPTPPPLLSALHSYTIKCMSEHFDDETLLTKQLVVRLTPEEYRQVVAAAAADDRTLSNWVRRVLRAAANANLAERLPQIQSILAPTPPTQGASSSGRTPTQQQPQPPRQRPGNKRDRRGNRHDKGRKGPKR